MKLALLAIALLPLSAQADMRFEYPCKVTQFVSINKDKVIRHPEVKKYTFVKVAFKAGSKWDQLYRVELTLRSGEVLVLPLVHSGSGDEGYEEYHIPTDGKFAANEALVVRYWINTGTINNDGSGASFQGDDDKGENVYFECTK